MLGFYLTSHPLAEHEQTLATYCSHTHVEAAELKHRTEVMLGGMLSAIKFSHTKNPKPGSPTATRCSTSKTATASCAASSGPSSSPHYGELVKPDAILVVRGAIDQRPGSEEANLIVNELIPLDDLPARYTRGVMIRVREDEHGRSRLDSSTKSSAAIPATRRCGCRLDLADGGQVWLDSKWPGIEFNPELRTR